jgi:uncharacterized UPF0146 family protein
MNSPYNNLYFNSSIFGYNYVPVAEAILNQYNPKSVIEFGCGNGELSKALAKWGIEVTATDGFANPDFGDIDNITFLKIDLNDPESIEKYLTSINGKYDVAICLEVAEHLLPSISEMLICLLTKVSDVVIFSAAIPGQDGEGHINCRSRTFWHEQFEKNNFFLRDSIRSQIRDSADVGIWYALNAVDYVRLTVEPTIEEYKNTISNLVASESAAASQFYVTNRKLEYKNQLLRLDIIWKAYKFRNMLKRLLGKHPNPSDKY